MSINLKLLAICGVLPAMLSAAPNEAQAPKQLNDLLDDWGSRRVDTLKVNTACPDITATGRNNFDGTRAVQQGAREPARLTLLVANRPTGTFSNEDGPLAW